jgi:hypothetical protein
MKIWFKVAAIACLSGALLNSCGSSDSLQCGEGTAQLDKQCVPVLPQDASVVVVTPDGGDSSVPEVVFRPTFGGVTSVAPVSTTSLLASWVQGTDPLTPQDNLVYHVYVGTASHMYAAPKTSPAGATSMLLTGLDPASKYFVSVHAVNEKGVEDANTVEKTGTPANDTTPPTFVGKVTATPLDPNAPGAASSIKLDWDPATDDLTQPPGLIYAVYWSRSAPDVRLAGGGTLGAVSDPGATSLIVHGLPTPNESYFFRVDAKDAAGNTTANPTPASAKTAPDTSAPTFKGCLTAVRPSAGGVNLTWAAAEDDSTPASAMTYTVYASPMPIGPDGGGFDFTKKTVFKDGVLGGRVGGLTPHSIWYFICRASDADGNEDTNTAMVSTQTIDDAARPSFGGLVSATLKGNTATLTWLPGTDDQTPAEGLTYRIYEGKADPKNINFAVAAYPPTAPGATTITLTKLAPGTIYYWIVRASDEAGNEDQNTNEKGVQTATTVCFQSDVYDSIIKVNCAVAGMCHGSDNPPQGLYMDTADNAYKYLVNQAAVEDQTVDTDGGLGVDAGAHVYQHRKRILAPNPNDPPPDESFAKQSYLYLKITYDPDIVGSPMPPPPRTPLSSVQVGTIRNWILQGALRTCQ